MKGIENYKLINTLERLAPDHLILEEDLKKILDYIGDDYYWSRERLEFIKCGKE